ncbi:Zinc finger, CCHC-type [Cinara cedri]|uniref:Zinc finger CCHC domain-containing protein 7 n=1 Tax=Cinara cedri TaxID=506608 RepID=A0A5E4MKG3_9HEMI|nr:Zinc finger, CCHC-type [Cinara cedri]
MQNLCSKWLIYSLISLVVISYILGISYSFYHCIFKQWNMDKHISNVNSECSSELSETQSEHEARVYSIIHHNDFSGTAGVPSIDPKYGVELNSNGEVIVFLKDSSNTPSNQANCTPNIFSNVCNNSGVTIPIINLDDNDMLSSKNTTTVIDNEFAETSLKKKKKKKKKKINLNDKSIEEYIEIVKTTNALQEYKEISGLNQIKPKCSNADNMALNVSLNVNERGIPMKSREILKQYSIGKPTECSLWYRCPKTWTPEMVKFYTKIRKSKRNFDCQEVVRKIKEKHGSNPVDWTLSPMDLYRSPSNRSNNIKCYICKKLGHTGNYCKERFKPEICIMCGLEGHNYHKCYNKCCLSCGKWQKNFTSNCSACLSNSRVVCSMCERVGHGSNYCTESWRQFHSTISTIPEGDELLQSTSKSNCKVTLAQSTKRKSETISRPLTPEVKEISNESPITDKSVKMSHKRAKRLKSIQLLQSNVKNSKNNVTIPDNQAINIDVNIQDITVERTLTKKHFMKKKKNDRN